MFLELKQEVEKKIKEKYGDISFEIREAPEGMGDLAIDAAFRLSKKLGKPPHEVGEEIKEILSELPFVDKIDVKNGYVNIWLDRVFVFEKLHSMDLSFGKKNQKIVLEHTSVNPNKAMHVGHLRNACIGDSLYRLLTFVGYDVEVHNYIDDTGNQVAGTLLGLFGIEDLEKKIKDREFLEKKRKELEEISHRIKLDHYCWDVYSEVFNKWEKEEVERGIKLIIHEIENKGSLFEFVKWFGEKIVREHLATVKQLEIHYDLLPRESDILSLDFWGDSFELMKKSEKFVYETEGPNKGCWVIKMGDVPEFSNMKNPDKIIIKSDGTVTYTGKDLAYHFWKFGILERDFHYRLFDEEENIWITEDEETGEEPEFGKADIVINVIDVRQEYPQKVLKYSLEVLGYKKEAENLKHYSYEVVALSGKSMEELGKTNKRYVHMSGRKGIGVKADDLIEAMKKKIWNEVEKRENIEKDEIENIVSKITQAAIRYYMVKQNTTKVLIFDFDEATKTEGDSGVYLQYALVRAKNIIDQIKEEKIGEVMDEEWELLKKLIFWDYIVEKGVSNMDLTVITDYLNKVAKTFTDFYHKNRVIGSEREVIRGTILKVFYKIYSKLLWIIGIPEVNKM